MGLFAEAIDDLFASDIAEDAIYQPLAGAARSVRVIRQQQDVYGNFGDTRLRTDRALTVEVRISDLPDPVRGETVVMNGQSWTIKSFGIDDADRLIWTLEFGA